jgi:hypothetical protein
MTYYRRLEKALDILVEIEEILEQQDKLMQTIHFKNKTCCDKVKEVITNFKEEKEDHIIEFVEEE